MIAAVFQCVDSHHPGKRVAISTDQQKSLSKASEKYDGDFAIPLVAGPGLNVFRKYRCFDNFEQQPLHGTLVIDAEGLLCWQDISHEPFMQLEFVLKEAQGLICLTDELTPSSHKIVAAPEDSLEK